MYSKEPPVSVLYCYGIHQPLYDDMERTIPNLTLRRGLPTEEELDEMDGKHRLVVIDDLMHQVVNNPDMELLFIQTLTRCKESHVWRQTNVCVLKLKHLTESENENPVSSLSTLPV